MLRHNYNLKENNTFGLDVYCKYFASFSSEEELHSLLEKHMNLFDDYLVIGEGSNLLFLSDYTGLIVHPNNHDIEIVSDDEHTISIRAGAGLALDKLIAWCVDREYYGMENLSHIPGTVGASPVQNVGAYGVEAKDIIQAVETIEVSSRRKYTFSTEQCRFSYRDSVFKQALKGKHIVSYVTFCLHKKRRFQLSYSNLKQQFEQLATQDIKSLRELIITIRDAKLPRPEHVKNAGSFFKNPIISIAHYQLLKKQYPTLPSYPHNQEKKIPAAWLIEQAGFKGKEINGAAVYQEQALVIINKGQATGADILALAQEIKDAVKQLYNIHLEFEVICIPTTIQNN